MKFFGKEISGLFTIPSGIVATEVSVLERIAKEIPEIGILTTKSIGIEKREGNREPILANFAPLSFLNAVGLANSGVKEFKKEISQISLPKNKFFLVSIFGKNEKEFSEIAERLSPFADGFELNLSCPHSQKYGQIIGQDFKLTTKIVRKVKNKGKPVLVKISPNIDYQKMVKVSLKAGADGVVAINTVGPGLYLKDGFPILSNKIGGVSGKAILPIGIRVVSEIRKLGNFPIIACGGISTKEDVLSYKKAGADFFGIGSSLFKMDFDEIKNYFKALNQDLKEGGDLAEKFLHKEVEDYKKFKIAEKRFLTKDLFILKLNGKIKICPGTFVFIWLPGIGEKPFSIFDDKPLTFLIRKVGPFTEKLSKVKKGSFLYLRGPYGEKSNFSGKILLCGGGTGVAGLSLFAKNYQSSVILFAKERRLLSFCKQKFEKFKKRIYLKEKFTVEALKEVIKKEKPNFILNCGPAGMIKEAIKSEEKFLPRERIYFSLNFKTKCGVGLCGSCATKKGLRSCIDGPFLNGNEF
ncbi:MAG: Dihydroorotate dehydrogenase B (NAD(+)), catalytic subunit [Syntrophomonadaceae bacterium]|nr:Dihydroorotate dehydrogenase B (NAD(+)), catalytic subunit [Bacillota bacterium]